MGYINPNCDLRPEKPQDGLGEHLSLTIIGSSPSLALQRAEMDATMLGFINAVDVEVTQNSDGRWMVVLECVR